MTSLLFKCLTCGIVSIYILNTVVVDAYVSCDTHMHTQILTLTHPLCCLLGCLM